MVAAQDTYSTNDDVTGFNDCVSKELIDLVWGTDVQQAIFDRWSQGFIFSENEQSALIQLEGGPCSVLTTVQAYLLKELIFCSRCTHNWRTAPKDEIDVHFLNALLSIITFLSQPQQQIFILASLEHNSQTTTIPSTTSKSNDATNSNQLSFDTFHSKIKFHHITTQPALRTFIYSHLKMWKAGYGVLLFLYSCLMTKSIQKLIKEIDDVTSLPLIDIFHGHGSQCLTNLLITGIATPHCFDGEKDVEGLKLHGVPSQAAIGFLSTLESLNYLEVGWHLKNPKYPLWILGSETHLTVCFSREKSLVESSDDGEVQRQPLETPLKRTLKIFRKYDTEKNGFIQTSALDTIIDEIKEFKPITGFQLTPQSTITNLKRKMDPDSLDIITEQAFIQELFPDEQSSNNPKKQQLKNSPLSGKPFVIYHYNGLPRSNKSNIVHYVSGEAMIGDYGYGNETSPQAMQPVVPGSYLPITGVLRTKWATIEIRWDDDARPSLN
ncbi:unnamed protein product [Didymodactylos carnosus]|uniref:Ubiquitin carboxyl-terminal hydrolase MINDY n=1 Tax=Didymodactylos carnosus TaxID=1234261 RepID=A0A813UF70_9BILA|nr:unnamed protein product [Didymodactylos carnosus]CAF1107224.1 unnamed protein product [Didymodactylos carnosus]CAF3615230.1 unnamed protein product [Didymodactylos carnosus]CAF3872008.1 unnamed protein product [Didymodactylos carnosus]